MRPMFNGRHHIPLCRSIRAQLVGDDPLGWSALFLQQSDQQSLGGLRVATRPDDFIENIRVVINGAPEPVFPTTNGNHRLVQMPDVLARQLLATSLFCVGRSEFPTPSPDRFTRNDNPALEEHFPDEGSTEICRRAKRPGR